MTKKPAKSSGVAGILANLIDNLDSLTEAAASEEPTSHQRRRIDDALRAVAGRIEVFLRELDPIRQPSSIFDPTNPKIIGRFTALALVAQDKHKLSTVARFYGSGVYAIYYSGAFNHYAPISATETPIYVGQAEPAITNARNPLEQGPRLARRLEDHRKNIGKATSTLNLDDFYCRFLVVQSGFETPAEDYLIHLFRPIWNSETKILYGLGKHGDASETRGNKRSPWDVLHPGRPWATTAVARTPAEIAADLKQHFAETTIYKDVNDVLRGFIDELKQV